MTNKPIPQDVIDKVKAKAGIKEVLESFGVKFHHNGGADYVAYSPFRDDKHIGSFHINTAKNIAKDFATGESWDCIEAVMDLDNKNFNEAVRMLASMVNVYIDDTPAPKIERVIKSRAPMPELPTLLRLMSTTDEYMGHEGDNPLICWMRSLKVNQPMLDWAIRAYRVGTAVRGKYKGWSVWWNIDELGYVHTAKLMAYKEDGHRDKTLDEDGREKFTWAHSLWRRAGMYDPKKVQPRTCLFGQHLLKIYPNAQVAIVESEKTAVICSTFCHPENKIWLATGGMSSLRKSLEVLIREGRQIALYPDKDGYEKWKKDAEDIGYKKMVVVTPKQQGWTEDDGPKADAADIMVRLMSKQDDVGEVMDEIDRQRQWAEEAALKLNSPEKADALEELIKKLDLIPENNGKA